MSLSSTTPSAELLNTTQPLQARSKTALVTELIIGFVLIEVTLWLANPVQRILFWASALCFLCFTVFAAIRGDSFGLKRPPWRVALVVVSLTIMLTVGMGAVADWLGTLHGLFGARSPLLHASLYLIWSGVQQFLQQSFFFARIERLTASGMRASFATALLFGLVHLPNPVLSAVTFAGGWILSEIFRRYRSLYPLAIAHGFTGLAIAVSVPEHLLHNMRVGLGYLMYPN